MVAGWHTVEDEAPRRAPVRMLRHEGTPQEYIEVALDVTLVPGRWAGRGLVIRASQVTGDVTAAIERIE